MFSHESLPLSLEGRRRATRGFTMLARVKTELRVRRARAKTRVRVRDRVRVRNTPFVSAWKRCMRSADFSEESTIFNRSDDRESAKVWVRADG
eukprot:1326788-Amorphochlora_amoeboformis.AAC.1